MSPEWVHSGFLSCSTDIRALGILLIELRVGSAPHAELEGLRQQGTHQATLQGMKQAPKYKDLTQLEWAFIDSCLVFDWQQRPAAAQLDSEEYIIVGPE